eukprot:5542420-Lingulodinium_polyedra.AAC.1
MDSPRVTCCGQDKNPPRVTSLHFFGTGPSPLMIEVRSGVQCGIPGALPQAPVHRARWHSLQ